jgi:hypothetical protein
LREQPGEEAAVAIAEDERAGPVGKLREEVEAASFKRPPKGDVFEPAIGASDAVEVGRRGCQLSVLSWPFSVVSGARTGLG